MQSDMVLVPLVQSDMVQESLEQSDMVLVPLVQSDMVLESLE